jgi:thioredoxin reductase (NADPH)
MNKIYDMLIIGGGPAGYTAALYGARAGLSVLVIEKLSAGGQIALSPMVENYPGFEEGIDGYTLGEKMLAGAERFGAETLLAEVTGVSLAGEVKTVETTEGTILGRTVVLATGADAKSLGLPKEKELLGRGISHCAACDGMFYKGKTVAIVGGGNTAAADALQLSRICKKVILIHRRDTLRATKIYHQPLMDAENVEFRWNSSVTELLADGRLTGLRVQNLKTGEESILECEGLFVSIGRSPNTGLVQGQLELDGAGYIVADESTRTSLPGVFAAGDVRTKELRQVITAAADGASAAHYAEAYLASLS